MIDIARLTDAHDIAEMSVLMWDNHTIEDLEKTFTDVILKDDSVVMICRINNEIIGFAQCGLRYDLIRGHIRTRAVENVCNTLTVNTIYPYQTATTVLYDKSGKELCYLERNIEGLLVYNLENREMDFGERGRKELSDLLVNETKF